MRGLRPALDEVRWTTLKSLFLSSGGQILTDRVLGT